jgi:hypothetical protein
LGKGLTALLVAIVATQRWEAVGVRAATMAMMPALAWLSDQHILTQARVALMVVVAVEHLDSMHICARVHLPHRVQGARFASYGLEANAHSHRLAQVTCNRD